MEKIAVILGGFLSENSNSFRVKAQDLIIALNSCFPSPLFTGMRAHWESIGIFNNQA